MDYLPLSPEMDRDHAYALLEHLCALGFTCVLVRTFDRTWVLSSVDRMVDAGWDWDD